MDKHTPGPWHVGGNGSAKASISNSGAVRVWAADSGSIADISLRVRLGDKAPSKEMLANARLIAAAPDLLSALEAICGDWFDRAKREYKWNATPPEFVEARAAIARARGQSCEAIHAKA